jgi:aryl-alcohol dehydrogenase (NADP+)
VAHLLASGKVLYFGVSNFRAWRVARMVEMCRAAGIPPPIVCQPPYNAMTRQDRNRAAAMLRALRHRRRRLQPARPLASSRASTHPARSRRRLARGAQGHAHPADRVPRRVARDSPSASPSTRSARGRTPLEFALGWVWNNALVHGVIGGPKTLAQWQEYLRALDAPFDADDEALVDSLVAPGTHRRRATPIRNTR